MDTPSQADFILIAPSGNLAICRHSLPAIPAGTRIASGSELLCAQRGAAFPWGQLPEPHAQNRQWKIQKVGVGGLIHDRWFVTSDGRFGGAPNVPETLPGSLRRCMFLDGGEDSTQLAENEGYAVVRTTTEDDRALFRQVQLHAARHVMADGGGIVHSPITDDGAVFVGFVGRCQLCPNAELISFTQLQAALPHYRFELWPEWRNWRIDQPGVR